jgi:uncharacterized protein
MRIRGIIWLPDIVEKLARKHHLTQREVQEVFAGKPQYRRLERGRVDGEDVYAAYGQTGAGRYVTAIFILKLDRMALMITARDMDRKERKQYES